jgi:NAD(P)H-hydrate epimerase
VATALGIQDVVSGFAPELMTEGLAETEAGSLSLRALEQRRMETILRGKTVVAVGPGISRHQESAELVRTLVRTRQIPMVLDADGLNAFEGVTQRLDGNAPLVVTPHPGEMARLTGLLTADVQKDRVGVARKFAHDRDCIVVLKGHRTLVAEPGGTVWVNTTGNPGMATGGTGDILTGMIAGMLAQAPSDLVRAVVFAVYLHGLAGDLARDGMGEQSMIATDLLKYLPAAFHKVSRPHSQSTVIQHGVGAWRTRPS